MRGILRAMVRDASLACVREARSTHAMVRTFAAGLRMLMRWRDLFERPELLALVVAGEPDIPRLARAVQERVIAGVAGSAMLSASGQNKFFLPLSLLIVTVNVIGNLCLMPWYGLAGIALSTVVTYVVSFITINVALVRKGLIHPPWTLMSDGVISIGTGVILVAVLLIEDAKLTAIPTLSQIALSASALGMFGVIAYLCTREVLSAIRRTA